MAVKTAKLTGAEAAVTGLDGSIAHIRNDGAGVVLASLKAGITEGADGVLSVPAGTSAALTGISGELHLLGIGSVVIVSNDYAECPFKSAVTLGSVTDEISRAAGGSNLLMNPDFRINQRGKSEYSTGYTVDRWYISTDKCKAAPESDGIRLTASVALASNTHAFWQNLEFPPAGGEYTLSLNVPEVSGVWSARIRTVNASGDYIDSYYTSLLHKGVNKVSVDLSGGEYISAVSVGINKGTEAGNSLKLAWVKLEIGGDATAFVPPDPATELVKCQRYFVRFGTRYGWFGTGFTSSTNRARLSQTLPVPMRDGVEHPTVTVHGTLYLNTPSKLGADAYALGDLIDSPILSENTICMGLVINDGAGLVEPCYGQLRDADSYIDISAEV